MTFRFVWIVFLATFLLHRLRVHVIQSIPSQPMSARDFAAQALLPGDIVYMSSKRLSWTNPLSYHAVYAFAALGTPFYHVFVVLRGRRLAHVIGPRYRPRLQKLCSDLHVGDIEEFTTARQQYQPVYRVLRRRDPRLFDDHLHVLCDRKFPPVPLLALHMMAPVVLPVKKYVHCNSFVGVLLEHMKLLPPVPDPQTAFIPNRLLNTYLPKAGFRDVGYYTIREAHSRL